MTATRIIFLDQVDSTQSEAQRLCAEGLATPPFAVIAGMQGSGRGRRGRGWTSIPGNLMMTVVVPAPVWAAGGDAEQASLKVAILVARFLRQRFGIRFTIKWPNDILFGGAKLGGILCDSSTIGDGFGDLFVGIGLNLVAAPDLPPDPDRPVTHVRTVCLQDVVGLGAGPLPDAETTGRELAAWIVSQWHSVPASALPAAFLEYSIEPGQAWISASTASVAIDHGVDDDGALRLGPRDSGPLKLNSSEHDWRWQFQLDQPVLVADVGNTRIKFADWPGPAAESPLWQATLASGDSSSFDGAHLRGRRVQVIAVSRSNLEQLSVLAREHGFGLHVVPKRPVFLRSEYAWAEIGTDRVAALEGFLGGLVRHERGDENSFGIVISAGTATTMDVVSFAGRHLGGMILPGVATALRSLHEAAPALPDLRSEAHRIPLAGCAGMSTATAILGGQRAVLLGAVKELLALIGVRAAQPPRTVRVAVTGGHGRTVMECLAAVASDPSVPCQVRLHEGLVLAGGRVMATGGIFL